MRWPAFLLAVALVVSGCTTATSTDTPAQIALEPSAATSAEDVEPASAVPSSTTTTTTQASPTTTTAPPPTTTTTMPAPTGRTVVDSEPEPEALLSPMAAAPEPVQIIEPTQTTFSVPATATEYTITFVATGKGRIDWFVTELPGGPEVEVGKGSTIDITFPFPITEDNLTYLVRADGKNPRAGEDSVTINLMRASS